MTGLGVSSIALGGLQAARERLDGAAGRIAARAAAPLDAPTAGSLEQDRVTQIDAGLTYRASLGVLRTEQAMLGGLLDLRA